VCLFPNEEVLYLMAGDTYVYSYVAVAVAPGGEAARRHRSRTVGAILLPCLPWHCPLPPVQPLSQARQVGVFLLWHA
jgi:hypothetical protein